MAAVKDGRSYRVSAIPAILFAQLFGAAAIALMVVWLLHFRGGVSLTSTATRLNMHHLLMFLGLVYLSGQAIIVFKTIPATRKVQKFFHMLLHLGAIVLGALGLFAVFKFKRDTNAADIRTLHSWLGIATISLYTLQWLAGFIIFLSPGASFTTRADFLPWHAFMGIILFLMAVLSAETGLAERFLLLGLSGGKEALVLNFTGIAILLYSIFIILAVILP